MSISTGSGERLLGLVGAAAGTIFHLFAGQLAGLADANIIYLIVAENFLGCVAIFLVGIVPDRPEAYCLTFLWI